MFVVVSAAESSEVGVTSLGYRPVCSRDARLGCDPASSSAVCLVTSTLTSCLLPYSCIFSSRGGEIEFMNGMFRGDGKQRGSNVKHLICDILQPYITMVEVYLVINISNKLS